MSRPELIKLLKRKHPKLNKPQLETIIDTFFESIEEALINKRSIELRGFGTWSTHLQKARISRNPKTGEKVDTPEKKTIHFKFGKELFDKINNEKK